MATWIVHLRVADKIASIFKDFNYDKFILGNLAPDSGVINKNGKGFIPDGKLSHFQEIDTDEKVVHPDLFYKNTYKIKRIAMIHIHFI